NSDTTVNFADYDYYVHKLFTDNAGDIYLPTDISSLAETKRIACSVVKNSHTNVLIVKMINVYPVPILVKIDWNNAANGATFAQEIVLTGKAGIRIEQPLRRSLSLSEIKETILPAYSFVIIKIFFDYMY
ncbi:MAG: hypothetical protein LBD45_08000, partial [Bacteroidales bacterium]|nr:hypothetical protein [Bacteroidales bacterium]